MSTPDIRPILRQNLIDTGLSEEAADDLLDYGESVGERLREARIGGSSVDTAEPT